MSVTKALNQNNLGGNVVTRQISTLDLAVQAWGPEWAAPDKNVYVFSDNTTRASTDRNATGIYGGGAGGSNTTTKALNQNNLGSSVTSRQISFLDLAVKAWGAEWTAPDKAVYSFNGGTPRESTDRNTTGIYGNGVLGQGAGGINYLMLEDSTYPDMASNSHVLQDDYGRLIL